MQNRIPLNCSTTNHLEYYISSCAMWRSDMFSKWNKIVSDRSCVLFMPIHTWILWFQKHHFTTVVHTSTTSKKSTFSALLWNCLVVMPLYAGRLFVIYNEWHPIHVNEIYIVVPLETQRLSHGYLDIPYTWNKGLCIKRGFRWRWVMQMLHYHTCTS